jgi:hypothetical protein
MPHEYEDLERIVYPLARLNQSMRRAQSKAIDPAGAPA